MTTSTSSSSSSTSSTNKNDSSITTNSSLLSSCENIINIPSFIEKPLIELAPGASQGAVVAFIGHPFDTIKTRAQDAAFLAKNKNSVSSSSINNISSSTSFYSITKDTYLNHGGIRAFYRGVTVPLFLKSAQRSIQYSLWDHLKAPPFSLDPFTSGAIVGAVGTIVVGCPAHVVKIHSQVSKQHMNAFQSGLSLLKSEKGILRSFFAGLHVNILKDTLFASSYLGLYDSYKKKIRPGCSAAESACVASAFCWLLLLPVDTLKTVVQSPNYNNNINNGTNNTNRATSSSSSIVTRLSNYIKKHGMMTLMKRSYTGLVPALLRAGPANAAAMTTYESVKSACDARRKKNKQ